MLFPQVYKIPLPYQNRLNINIIQYMSFTLLRKPQTYGVPVRSY